MTGPVSIRGFSALLIVVSLASPARSQVVAPAGDGSAESLRVTREQAIQEALARNPGLIASQEQIEQARAQVVIAGREDLLKSREYACDFLEKTQARFLAGTMAKVDVASG